MQTELSEQEIEAFVDRNASYYLERWTPVLAGRQHGAGFNWAAALLSGLWLPYRKMYRATLILYGIILVETILEEVLFVWILEEMAPPRFVSALVAVVVGAVCGACGNRWYLRHVKKWTIRIRSQGLEGESHLYALAKRGGTNLVAAIGFALGFVLLTVLVGFVVAFVWLMQLPLTSLSSVSDAGPVTPIVVGQDIADNIEGFVDVDAFSFDAVEGEHYVIRVDITVTETALADPLLTLWDTDGATILMENDDHGNSLASLIAWEAPRAGTFYLTVQNADGISTGDYTLTLRRIEP